VPSQHLPNAGILLWRKISPISVFWQSKLKFEKWRIRLSRNSERATDISLQHCLL
jgi:hypothetical protein